MKPSERIKELARALAATSPVKSASEATIAMVYGILQYLDEQHLE